MRQPLIAVLTLVSLAISTMAAAQVQTPSGSFVAFYCYEHPTRQSFPCSGQFDCATKEAEHKCKVHGHCQGGREESSPAKMMPFPMAAGLLGFLGGDLVVYTDTGNKMNTTFGWGGVSAGSVLVMAVNSGKMSRGTAIGYGLLAGASGGLAWSAYQTAKGEEAKTGVNVGLGTAAGLALGAVFAFAPPSPNLAPRWMGPNAKVQVVANARRIGMIAVW